MHTIKPTYNPLLLAENRRAPLSRQWLDEWGEELSWRDDELHTGREKAIEAQTILAELEVTWLPKLAFPCIAPPVVICSVQ